MIKRFDEYLNEAEAKYTEATAKNCPKNLLKKVYDSDDNVLFGSRRVKGKVAYIYVPEELMVDGIPYIIGSEISYDGKGNADLPKGTEIMAYNELHTKFKSNKFD